ncbi:hypothetical protein [Priestia aryabhattai]|uniref:hypothetical protein n=1 Tax=Priestia aryabhattai TaxID=412384 RepID=UPI00064F3491|nr:hypothetical protein [Priestia aryabhattai]KML29234.1 hypothetical protein VL11_10810 [Priestia aryabhattai]KMO01141.1 hypothetical protein ABV89_04230 [Priestia aryabhattai]
MLIKTGEWTEVINGKEVKVQEYVGEKAIVKTYGEPNIKAWAKKLKQVYEDMKAGRYDKEEG